MDRAAREKLAFRALIGLSVGDAFGERFFAPKEDILTWINERQLPPPPWRWTDDTEMALSIVDVLFREGGIAQDELARCFAERMDSARGYGAGAHDILERIRAGESWLTCSASAFSGQGSFGNGAAMRVAPVGGYFADDLDRVVLEAERTARITHAHDEGVAGAVAVAVAAATAVRARIGELDASVLFEEVLAHTPAGHTRRGIEAAAATPADAHIVEVASQLGNGSGVTAPDTVPLCMWAAAHHLDSYEEALFTTVSALGDRDTTCAIVGGIVALSSSGAPEHWLEAREPLPEWLPVP